MARMHISLSLAAVLAVLSCSGCDSVKIGLRKHKEAWKNIKLFEFDDPIGYLLEEGDRRAEADEIKEAARRNRRDALLQRW